MCYIDINLNLYLEKVTEQMQCEILSEDQWLAAHVAAKAEATTVKAFDPINADRHDLLLELQLVENAVKGTIQICYKELMFYHLF
jgi:hypothetical protein